MRGRAHVGGPTQHLVNQHRETGLGVSGRPDRRFLRPGSQIRKLNTKVHLLCILCFLYPGFRGFCWGVAGLGGGALPLVVSHRKQKPRTGRQTPWCSPKGSQSSCWGKKKSFSISPACLSLHMETERKREMVTLCLQSHGPFLILWVFFLMTPFFFVEMLTFFE